MKVIKIINGTYGHRPAGSRGIEPKQACDAPFEIEDDKAERLVSRGIAVYVGEPTAPIVIAETEDAKGVATGQESSTAPPPGGNTSDTENAPKAQYSIDMKAVELREILEQCGLVYKVGMTKAAMVAALDEYFEEEADDDEQPPALGAAEPVI
ncbi:MAG: hypothetical protein ABFD97_00415 [Syntrophobacter sp.]